jgi:two-component system, cell cycle sensor histidine kinase PleC
MVEETVDQLREELHAATAELWRAQSETADLQREVAALRDQLRKQREFLASGLFELRTPLNAIAGFSELISREHFGPLGSPKYCECARDLVTSAHFVMAIFNEVYDLLRVASGKWGLRDESVDVDALVQQALRSLEARMAGAGGTVAWDAPAAGLPRLRCDSRQLELALRAVLLSARGFIAGHVTINAETGDGLTLVVANNLGKLLPRDIVQARDFAHLALDGPGVAHAVLLAHGGALEIEIEPGVSDVFRLRFPPERVLWGDKPE